MQEFYGKFKREAIIDNYIHKFEKEGYVNEKELANLIWLFYLGNLLEYRLDDMMQKMIMRKIIKRRKNSIGFEKNNGTEMELLSSGFLKYNLMNEKIFHNESLSSPGHGYDIISEKDGKIIISEVKSSLSKSNVKDNDTLIKDAFKSTFCDKKKVEDQFKGIQEKIGNESILKEFIKDYIYSDEEITVSGILCNPKYKEKIDVNLFICNSYFENEEACYSISDSINMEKILQNMKCNGCTKACFIGNMGEFNIFIVKTISNFNWDIFFDEFIWRCNE